MSGSGYAPTGKIADEPDLDSPDSCALRECLLGGGLCNDAGLRKSGRHWEITGDPTEGALLVALRKGGLDEATLQKLFPRLDEILSLIHI